MRGGAKVKIEDAISGKKKKLNLKVAREHLKELCTNANERNLKPDGPYGDVCNRINGLANTKPNRKRLQTYWLRFKKLDRTEGK